MYKPTPEVLSAIRADAALLPEAAALQQAAAVESALAAPRPDLTEALLRLVRAGQDHGVAVSRQVTAAACRAACGALGQRHPGRAIEVRVPPFAAAQIGFGSGPTHTRGTPPNVAELAPAEFLRLVTGAIAWDEAAVSASGVHTSDAAIAFPFREFRRADPAPTD
ncbi:MAG: sterol carrier family protein [Arachnia sp.]